MPERDLLGRSYDPWGHVLGDEEADRLRDTYARTGQHAGRGPEVIADLMKESPKMCATD